MSAMQHFSQRFKALREEAGFNQSDIAEKLGVSRGSISFYENGDRIPDIEFLLKAASFFHVSADYLIGTSDARVPEYRNFVELTGFNSITVEHLLEISGHGKSEWRYEYIRAAFELFILSKKFDELMLYLRSYLEMTIPHGQIGNFEEMFVSFDNQVRKRSKSNLCVLATETAAEVFIARAQKAISDLFLDVKRLADMDGGWQRHMPNE